MSRPARGDARSPATEAELLALPDEGRGFELIDGELFEKQAGFRHSYAQSRLNGRLDPFNRRQEGGAGPGGWWILTEQLVRLGAHVLRPDVAGWRREHLVRPPADDDAVLPVRPDWVCEILSPGNAGNDLIKKKRLYHQHRVPHYWVVDPRDESLTVHRFGPDGYIQVLLAQRGDLVRAEPFEAIELSIGVLFDDDA